MRRREFLALLPAGILAAESRNRTADEVLHDLLEGNQRFAAGHSLNPRRGPAEFSKLASGQAPEAVIVGCADSRVPPEILFDQGVGDLFVIRVAGNVIDGAGPTVEGSVAYGQLALGAKLIMVLGHSGCGAVKSALASKEPAATGSIHDLVGLVHTGGEQDLDRAVAANVRFGVAKLNNVESALAANPGAKRAKVVGAVYNLASGKVTVIA